MLLVRFITFFFKIFVLMWTIKKKLHWICYNITPIFKMFWFFDHRHVGLLVPWAGIKLGPSAVRAGSLTTGQPGDSWQGVFYRPVIRSQSFSEPVPLHCEFHKCFSGCFFFFLSFFWPTWVRQNGYRRLKLGISLSAGLLGLMKPWQVKFGLASFSWG